MSNRDLMEMKAEKLRILEQESMRFYQPSPTQLAFHKSQAKIRLICAGNQFGKTHAGCMEIGWTVGRVHPYRANVNTGVVKARDCCVSFNTIQSVLIPHYQRMLPRGRCDLGGKTFEGRPRIWPGLRGGTWESAFNLEKKTLYLDDDSFIEFKSYEQGREAIQGSALHIIREDEEPRQKEFHTENLARQITTGVNLVMTMTPLNYSQWVYGEIYEAAAKNKDIETFTGATSENRLMDETTMALIEEGITDEVERAARLHGAFAYAEGRVWKEYGAHNVVEPFVIPEDWPKSIVIDPHPDKPTAVNWFAEDPRGKLYVYREADIKGDVKTICDKIASDSNGEYIDLILMDPSARQSASIRGQGSLIGEFRKHFTNIIEANNNRLKGWDAVRKAVADRPGGPMLYVFKSCPVTDFQMKNYSFKPPLPGGESRGKPEVVKRNDDHPDNVRYRCMAQFSHTGAGFEGFNIGVYANG